MKLPENTAPPPQRVYSPVLTSGVDKEVTGKGKNSKRLEAIGMETNGWRALPGSRIRA